MNRSDERPLEPYDATIEPRKSSPQRPGGGVARLRGRRSRSWLWVLPLLALLALGAWLLRYPELRRDARNAIEERDVVGTSGRSSGTITELSDVRDAETGGRAELSNVLVTDVTGDETFWVGSGSERLRVQFAEHSSADENRVRVRSGQRLDLSGILRNGQTDIYLQADQLRIR
jgi:hypothetical protein